MKISSIAIIALLALLANPFADENPSTSPRTPLSAFERFLNWGCSPGGEIVLDYHGQHTGQSCVTWRALVDKTANAPNCAWVVNLDIPHDSNVSFRLRCDIKYLLIGMEDENGRLGLCPTLPDVAPQTWGEVRLKPSDLPVMGDPKAKLGRVVAMVFLMHGGAGEAPSSGLYSCHFDCMRLVLEDDPPIDNPKEIPPQRPAFDEIKLLPKEEFIERFEKVKNKLEEAEAVVKTLKSEGKRADYETASVAVVRCLLNAPMEDFQTGWLPHRATKMLLFFEECLDRAERGLNEIRSGERKSPEIPAPSMAKLSIRDGVFFSGDQPVLLTGLMGWGLDTRLSLFSELGFNFFSIETGLSPNMPEEGVFQKDENVPNHIKAAQEHNFAMDLLVSPHYRPTWIDKKYPGVDVRGQRRARGHFTNWNVSDPDFQRVCAEYASHLMSYIKNAPNLVSLDLSNEVWYDFAADYPLEDFQAFLKKRYANLFEMNRRWNADFSSWDKVNVRATSWASWLDFNWYNQDRVTRWYAGFAKAFRDAGCEIPAYCKVVGNAYEVMGVDKDAFSEELDACGADCFPRNDPEGFHLASDFREQQTIIDLYKSCYPEKAIIDTEYHIMHYWIPVSPQHIRAMMWDGAVHGRSAAGIWVWGRNLENPEHSIMNQPWCFEALAHSALDLRRFSREIFALSNVKPEIALIYNGYGYMKSYEDLYFTGLPFRLLTDRRITNEILERFKVVVAPAGAAVSEAAAAALEAFAKNGGRILGEKDSLLRNLYGDEIKTRAALKKVVVIEDSDSKNPEASDLRKLLEAEEFETRHFRLESPDNKRLNVTWRSVKLDDSWLLFAINYDREAREAIIKPSKGISIKDGVNQITGDSVGVLLTLPSLEPTLCRYRLLDRR